MALGKKANRLFEPDNMLTLLMLEGPTFRFCNTCWSRKHGKKCHRCWSCWPKSLRPDSELTSNCDCDSVVCLTGHDGPDTNAKLSCSSTVAYASRPIRCHSGHPECFRHTLHTNTALRTKVNRLKRKTVRSEYPASVPVRKYIQHWHPATTTRQNDGQSVTTFAESAIEKVQAKRCCR